MMFACVRPIVLAAVLACAGPVLAHGIGPDVPAPQKAAPAAGNTRAQVLTLALQNGAAAPINTSAPQGIVNASLVQAARDRHDELVLLTVTDPAEVLRVALPPEVRAKLPAALVPYLEQPADETGDLEVLHVDHVNPAEDYYLHILTTTAGRYTLHFAGKTPELASGARVRVKGVRVDSAIVVDGATDVMTQKALYVMPNTLGVQKTLTILVNFADAPTAQPYSTAQAQSVVFGTTSNFDMEVSYGQTSLAGDVAGWYTIAELSTACNYTNIATQARSAASAHGIVLANYTRYVYVFPANTCGWWGLGTVGGNPSQAWIHSKYGLTLGVVGHEMGHNFGLYHSHSLDCGTVPVAASGCTTSEYGDQFDLMGNSNGAHYNAYHKERLGWLNAGISPPLTTVAAGSPATTYTIAPIELARNTASRALKIPRTSSCTAPTEWFYVETRQAGMFAGNANILGGVLIHKVTEGSVDSSYLLDMTAATASWTDPALVAGQSFVDPQTGLTIQPVSVGATGAQVTVSYPAAACTRAAPTMTFTPSGTVWTSAGAITTYAVQVTSQDGCGCAATSFDLSATVPSGWTATAARTASVGPGASTSGSITVASPANAPANFYSVGLKAANVASSNLAATGTSTVNIAAPVSTLTVTPRTAQATYTLPTSGSTTIPVAITTTVSNGATPVSGTNVAIVVTDPSGRMSSLKAKTGTNGVATVNYNMRSRNAVKGTYTVTSTATVSSVTAKGSTSFLVN